jgi:hypothetical protein
MTMIPRSDHTLELLPMLLLSVDETQRRKILAAFKPKLKEFLKNCYPNLLPYRIDQKVQDVLGQMRARLREMERAPV